MKSPTSLKQILLANNPDTQRLIQQATNLIVLNRRLSQLLPTQHCQIAALEHGTLIIIVSSSAWATRLRLQQSILIKAYRDMQVQTISTRINPTVFKQTDSTLNQPRTMSMETCKLLINLSETTSHPKLKQALHRLSLRAKK